MRKDVIHTGSRRCCKSGFTIPEVLMVLVIGGMVLGSLTAVMVQSYKIWSYQVGQWYLAHQGRMARERMLRGVSGATGLRSARAHTLEVVEQSDSGAITFQLPGMTNHYYSVWQHPSAATYVDGATANGLYCSEIPGLQKAWKVWHAGANGAVRQPMAVDSIQSRIDQVKLNNRVVSCDYRLLYEHAGRVFTNRYRIYTYVVND